jgi:hypothetical protein
MDHMTSLEENYSNNACDMEMRELSVDELALISGGEDQPYVGVANGDAEICIDGYTALGGAIGAALTAESLGWGSVPGSIIGGMLGRRVCH